MVEIKISFIVPIYNVEDFLNKCLDSIKKQTYSNFECLMICDGSPDNSAEIMKKYSDEDDRFIPLFKENGGPSSARNYGMQFVSGEYIAFVDGDDYIEPNYLEVFVNNIIVHNERPKIVYNNIVLNEKMEVLNEKSDVFAGYSPKGMMTAKDCKEYFMHHTIPNVVWNKLFRADFLVDNQIKFRTAPLEDIIFTLEMFGYLNNGNVIWFTEGLYHYRQDNPNSIIKTLTKDERAIDIHLKSIDAIKEVYDTNNDMDVYWKKRLPAVATSFFVHGVDADKVDKKKVTKYVRKNIKFFMAQKFDIKMLCCLGIYLFSYSFASIFIKKFLSASKW